MLKNITSYIRKQNGIISLASLLDRKGDSRLFLKNIIFMDVKPQIDLFIKYVYQ